VIVDDILLMFWVLSWILIGTIYLHSVGLSFFGARRWKPRSDHAPEKRFAVLVAAHNEAEVIGAFFRTLRGRNIRARYTMSS